MKIIPYLSFAGNCEEAMSYYTKVLKGKLTGVMRYGDAPGGQVPDEEFKDKILHGEIVYGNDEKIYCADSMQSDFGNSNISLMLDMVSESELNRVYESLSKDARQMFMPLQDTFWGAKYAAFIDQFGVNWSLNFTKPK